MIGATGRRIQRESERTGASGLALGQRIDLKTGQGRIQRGMSM